MDKNLIFQIENLTKSVDKLTSIQTDIFKQGNAVEEISSLKHSIGELQKEILKLNSSIDNLKNAMDNQ